MPSVPPPADVMTPRPGARPCAGDWRCDPVNETYVRRFLDLAARHRITVYWLLTPYSPGTQPYEELSGNESLYLDFIRSVQPRYPDLVVIDGRHAGFGHSAFLDGGHLHRDGAARLSIGLADLLNRPDLKTGSRWVPLPAYPEPPADFQVEDISHTYQALKATPAGRRF